MTKNDLKNYRALVLELRQLQDLVTELGASRFTVSGGDFSGMPHEAPSPGSPVERKTIRYLDALVLYQEKVAETSARLLEIEAALSSLDSPVERVVMRCRYIEGRSWVSICAELELLGYCERQVYYIHGAALKKLKEL